MMKAAIKIFVVCTPGASSSILKKVNLGHSSFIMRRERTTLIFSLRPLHGAAGVTIWSTFFSYFPPKELGASILAALFPLFSTMFLMSKEMPFRLA